MVVRELAVRGMELAEGEARLCGVSIGPVSLMLYGLTIPKTESDKRKAFCLLQRAIAAARSKGYEYIHLYVASTNPEAREVFEELGFRITNEELHMLLEGRI